MGGGGSKKAGAAAGGAGGAGGAGADSAERGDGAKGREAGGAASERPPRKATAAAAAAQGGESAASSRADAAPNGDAAKDKDKASASAGAGAAAERSGRWQAVSVDPNAEAQAPSRDGISALIQPASPSDQRMVMQRLREAPRQDSLGVDTEEGNVEGMDVKTNPQYERERAAFRNVGFEAWKRARAEWTKNNATTSTHYDSDLLEDFDEEEIVYCLQKGKRFPANIPLGVMVEMLDCLWEEEEL
jgi:hypothetical protein